MKVIYVSIILFLSLVVTGCTNQNEINLEEQIQVKEDSIKSDKAEQSEVEDLRIAPDLEKSEEQEINSYVGYLTRIVPGMDEAYVEPSDLFFKDAHIPEESKILYTEIHRELRAKVGQNDDPVFNGDYEVVVLEDGRCYLVYCDYNIVGSTHELDVPGTVIDVSAAYEGRIFILYETEEGVSLRTFSSEGSVVSEEKFFYDDYNQMYFIPKDESHYYIMACNENETILDEYALDSSYYFLSAYSKSEKSTGEKTEKVASKTWSEQVLNVELSNNLLFVHMQDKGKDRSMNTLNMYNYDFDLLQSYKVPVTYTLKQITLNNDPDGKLIYQVYLSDGPNLYSFDVDSSSQFLYPLVSIIDNNKIYIDCMKSELTDFLENNYTGVNFYKGQNIIVKSSNNNYQVQIYTENKNEVTGLDSVIQVADHLIWFDNNNYTIEAVQPLNEKFDPTYETGFTKSLIGQNIFWNTVIEGIDGSVLYIDRVTKIITKVNKNGDVKRFFNLENIEKECDEEINLRDGNLEYILKEFEEALVFAIENKLFITNKESGVMEIVEAPDSLHYDKSNGKYGYDLSGDTYYYDFELKDFFIEYPFIKTSYKHLQYDDKFYLNFEEYYYDDEYSEYDFLNIRYEKFITIDTVEGEIKAIENKYITIADGVINIVKEYDQHLLYQVDQSGTQLISSIGVRDYDVSERGVLFTGYDNNSKAYFYDFENKELNVIDEGLCNGLALNGSLAVLIMENKELKVIDLESLKVNARNLQEFELDDYNNLIIKAGKTENTDFGILISSESHEIVCVDLHSLKQIDHYYGVDGIVTNQGDVVYIAGAYIVKYNVDEQKMVVIDYEIFPFGLMEYNEYVIYDIGFDGPGYFGITKIEGNSFEEYEEYDYVLSSIETPYSHRLYIYDNESRRLEHIITSHYLEMKIEDDGIRYYIGDTWDKDEVLSEGFYPLKKGASVFVQDEFYK